MEFTVSKGFTPEERACVADLYWNAFAIKLAVVMGPRSKAISYITTHLDPKFALVGRNPSNEILGIAGFKTTKGALIGGGLGDLFRTYGLSVAYRAPLLALVERALETDVLLMDGICVAAEARGLGLGSALLAEVKAEAQAQNLATVRLDVIDTNPRARALYERKGFVAGETTTLGPLAWIFGFNHSTTMHCHLTADT